MLVQVWLREELLGASDVVQGELVPRRLVDTADHCTENLRKGLLQFNHLPVLFNGPNSISLASQEDLVGPIRLLMGGVEISKLSSTLTVRASTRSCGSIKELKKQLVIC